MHTHCSQMEQWLDCAYLLLSGGPAAAPGKAASPQTPGWWVNTSPGCGWRGTKEEEEHEQINLRLIAPFDGKNGKSGRGRKEYTSRVGALAPNHASVRNPPASTPYARILMLCSLHSETSPHCSGLLSRREYCTYRDKQITCTIV